VARFAEPVSRAELVGADGVSELATVELPKTTEDTVPVPAGAVPDGETTGGAVVVGATTGGVVGAVVGATVGTEE